MGEHPLTMTFELTCPGCQAHFRLRPKKKMPTDDVPCPKCGSAIPLSEPSGPAPRLDRSLLSTPATPNLRPPEPPRFTSDEAARRAPTVPTLQSESSLSQSTERERTVSIDEETWEQIKKRALQTHHDNPKGSITNPLFPKQGHPEEAEAPAQEKDTTKEIPKLDFGHEPEQGPFDLRDILSAEQQAPGLINPNEVTRSPGNPEGAIPTFMEEDSDLAQSPPNDEATLAVSATDEFEDGGEFETTLASMGDAEDRKEALGALIRKKLGAKKLDVLRSKVEGAQKDSEEIPPPRPDTTDETHGVPLKGSIAHAPPGQGGGRSEADETLESALSDEISERLKPATTPPPPVSSSPRLTVSESLKNLRSPLRDAQDPPKETHQTLPLNTRSVSWNQFSPAGTRSEVDEQGVVPPIRSLARTRGAQDSHSGLFPIRGVGQEASAITGLVPERRGSGYIRLPTTEIMEVLGAGNYRLMVENIVYEPVDEAGLTELIKRGVLMGAEMIAEPGEEWQPINDHPVFKRLRKKMAIEAHALLAKYTSQEAKRQQEEASDQEAPPPLPSASGHTLMMGSLDLAKRQPSPWDSEEEEDESAGADPFDSIVDLSSELEAHPSLFAPEDEPERGPRGQDSAEIPWEAQSSSPGLAGPDFVSIPEEDLEEPSFSEPGGEEELMPLVLAHEAEPDSQSPPLPAPEPSRRRPLMPLLAILALCGLGILAYVLYEQFTPQRTRSPLPLPPVSAKSTGVSDAIEAAKQSRQLATTQNLDQQAGVLEHAATFASQGKTAAALELFALSWDAKAATDTQSLAYVKALAAKDPKDPTILTVARAALAGQGNREDARFAPYLKAAAPDLARGWEPEVMGGEWGQTLRAKDVGDFKVLTILEGDKEAWSFKPVQPGYPLVAAHRDVAASRLCQAVQCEILVPMTRLARLDEARFKALGGTGAQADVLPWTRDKGGRFLVGSAKAWVPQGVSWPIEFSTLWRPWLAPYEPVSKLSEPLSESLEPLKSKNAPLYGAIVATPGLSTARLAQQVSAMMIFDYLTNNMNRFRERPVFQGTDNQLLGTQLVSLDHATTFQTRLSSRVAGRFAWAGRYDKELIDRIKTVDREALDQALFGRGSELGEVEKKAFWSRHADLVSDIEAQVKRYGAQDVYPF